MKKKAKIVDDKGTSLKFKSANDAINKTYSILEEEKKKSEYKFPSPDYLSFKGVRWINPDESDQKDGSNSYSQIW